MAPNSRIILIRHGQAAHNPTNVSFPPNSMNWFDGYNLFDLFIVDSNAVCIAHLYGYASTRLPSVNRTFLSNRLCRFTDLEFHNF